MLCPCAGFPSATHGLNTCCYLIAMAWVHACLQYRPAVSMPPYAHLLVVTQPSSQPPTSLPEPIMMSLRPGSELLESQPLPPEKKPFSNSMVQVSPGLLEPMAQLATNDDRTPRSLLDEKTPKWAREQRLEEKSWLTNGTDIFECPPPKTENEVGGEERPAGWGSVMGWEGSGGRRAACWT